MKPADTLFQLVKSLTKSEKRHFKLFASKHVIGEVNNYVKLFDAIEKQGEYDQQEIIKVFARESFVKRLSSERAYLYHLILKSLRAYHFQSSVEVKINALLHEVEILFKKTLFDQCAGNLEKATLLATENEVFSALPAISRWGEKITFAARKNIDEIEALYQGIFKLEKEMLEKLENVNQYRNINLQTIILLKREGRLRSKKQLEKFSKYLLHPLMENEKKALSFSAKLEYYSILFNYSSITNDTELSHNYLVKAIELMELYPTSIQQAPHDYIVAFSNLLYLYAHEYAHEKFYFYLEKLRKFSPPTKDAQLQIEETYYQRSLEFHSINGDFEKGITLIEKLQASLTIYEHVLINIGDANTYYNFSYAYFGNRDYRKALEWINKVLNDRAVEDRQSLYCQAKILDLLIHFELGNTFLLEYIEKSAHRYFKKKERLYKFEQLFLNFMKTVVKNTGDNGSKDIFKSFKNKLMTIKNDPYEKKIMEALNILHWLDSKIENKPFAEIIKQNCRGRRLLH